MNQSIKAVLAFIAMTTLLVVFNNCSGAPQEEQTSQSLAACKPVDAPLGTPNSLGEVIQLINTLPKPLTLDCFLKSLQRPLGIMAVNNTFSAQPAVGNDSPRIFILNSRLALSVVPAGSGRTLLEMSEPLNGVQSWKAELEFPIAANVDPYQMFDHITDRSTGTSRCTSCHTGETKQNYAGVGFGFVSNTVRPNESQRVNNLYLRNQAYICNPSTNKYRCDILQAVFSNGSTQDIAFPF
jgi:hypothetical protein